MRMRSIEKKKSLELTKKQPQDNVEMLIKSHISKIRFYQMWALKNVFNLSKPTTVVDLSNCPQTALNFTRQ